MVVLLRALARLVTFVLLVTLAAVGLAVAIFSVGGSGDLSLAGLAELAGLPELEQKAGRLLRALESDGPIAARSALAGLGVAAVGVLLLIGALAPTRERLVVLDRTDEGTLAARRRPLSQVARALVEQARGVTAGKVKLRPSRGERGGKLKIQAAHSGASDPDQIEQQATAAVSPLAKDFQLKTRVRARLGGKGKRVQ